MLIPAHNRGEGTPNLEARTLLTACIVPKLKRLNLEELQTVYATITGILDRRPKQPAETD